jgi:hypothetical protein
MLMGFFFYHEGVHREYPPSGQTITKEYYIKVLRQLTNAVRSKWAQLWASGDGSFIMIVRLPSLQLSCRIFGKTHITQVCQPPTAQIWLPATWLFPKIQLPLKVRRFVSVMVTQYISSLNSVSLPTD